nr:tetratricopeptide repeat protein [Pseudomonadota bacterium]
LEGSVRKVGDTVRVSASLTKAVDGSVLWSHSYDRPYKDLFALQDAITAQVATALKAQLQPPPPAHSQQGDRPPSENLEAYSAYLQALSATELGEATRLYNLSVQLDPDYGLAYSRKARMLLDTLANGGLTGTKAVEAFAEADKAIQQALRLAPNQASTHIARGYLLMLRDFDWKGSEAEFKRAVELAPEDGEALFQLGVARASQGDLAQAVELTKKALTLDPLNVVWDQWLVAYLMPLGRLDEAEKTVGHVIELKPNLFFNRYLLAVIKVLRKDVVGAKKAAEAEPAGPWQDFALALAAQIAPNRAAADEILQVSIDEYSSGWAFQIAQLFAVRGEPDQMFEWLDRAWKARDPGMQSLLYDALLLRYRNDPRYAALAKEVGLPNPTAAAPPQSAQPAAPVIP